MAEEGGPSVPGPWPVRIGGRPCQVTATLIPSRTAGTGDPGDPYTGLPGGGDRESIRLVEEGSRLGIAGDMRGAARLYRRVLARFPDHYAANYSMGNAVRLAGRPRAALKYFRRAARAWPENHLAYAGMGRALLDAGEHERALRHLDRALRRQPGDRIVLKDREEALGKIGRAGGGGNPARA